MFSVSRIRKALTGIMSDGEANACRIYKGWAYDGSVQRYGWHFERFGSTPTWLGDSVTEAIENIDQIKTEREEVG
jgi:hypothetical protein